MSRCWKIYDLAESVADENSTFSELRSAVVDSIDLKTINTVSTVFDLCKVVDP